MVSVCAQGYGKDEKPMTTTQRTVKIALAFVVVPHFFSSAAAAPTLSNDAVRNLLTKREETTALPVQIWMPILIIGVIIVVLSVALCYRRSIAARFTRRQATTTTAGAPGTRELTAEQLAGTINNAAAPTTGRSRRTRRPRRTPSQISTTSLPAYAKEPGEEELVIFRGPEDMEDAGMPLAIVMPPLSEDGEESMHSRHSRDNSQASRYTAMPTTPNDTPLLNHDDSSADDSRNNHRRSFETLVSSEEASSLMRANSNVPEYEDPRGEAPAYFEAVDISDDIADAPPQPPALPLPSPPDSPEQVPQRRSGFRRVLNALPNRLSMAPSHTRASSAFSMGSSDQSHGRDTSQSRASHRPTPSGSGSLLSLSPFRTISRQREHSNANLTSPSLISLNSISAPLSHTLMRTEFTYPKAGPTPEQLKLISSRESFARFGMPYGADAIAYAASASRHDLDVPPPDFDVQPLPTDTRQAPGAAGPSRLRSASNAADLQREATESSYSSTSSTEPPSPDLSASHLRPSGTDASSAPSVKNATSITSPNVADFGPSSSLTTDIHIPAVPLTQSPSVPESLSTSSAPPVEGNTLSISKKSPSYLATAPPSPGPGLAVPPTSFRTPSTSEGRSESRASSIQSFATAAESMMMPSQSDQDDSDAELEEPTTPTMGGRHVLEGTDATITQGQILQEPPAGTAL